MTARPAWLAGLTHKDWLLDGSPIRGEVMLEMWEGLDWSRAWVDMGPSIAGNPGPYWHVPYPPEETVHRLYPKLLLTKWLDVVRQAVAESVAKGVAPGVALVPLVPTDEMARAGSTEVLAIGKTSLARAKLCWLAMVGAAKWKTKPRARAKAAAS